MDRLSDDQLREVIVAAKTTGFYCLAEKTIVPIVEELLERRAADRNADITAAEMRRWNGEE